MIVPRRKISNAYHNSLISLAPHNRDREFRDFLSNYEALERIRQIREDYDVNTFIDISVLVPICHTCKESADRKNGEFTLPEVDFPNWQSHYENIGINKTIIQMMEEQIREKNWESLFCFCCHTNIYFPKTFSPLSAKKFFLYSSPILEYYGCGSSSGKSPPQWMRDALVRVYGEICLSCNQGLRKDFITLDHINPSCLGGGSNFLNLQILCKECNQKKADKHPKIIISQIIGELLPPEVDIRLSALEKRIDFSGDDLNHNLAPFFYKTN